MGEADPDRIYGDDDDERNRLSAAAAAHDERNPLYGDDDYGDDDETVSSMGDGIDAGEDPPFSLSTSLNCLKI